jgi:hypothetical protein
LSGGIVWVRDNKGAHTQVETPSMTAVARGTTFTVEQTPNGSTIIRVYDGTVDVLVGGKTVSVGAGQEILVGSNGAVPPIYNEPDVASPIPANELPVGYGGGVYPWYLEMTENLGIGVTVGTSAVLDMRTSAIGEALQQLGQATPNQNANSPLLFDAFDLNRFFTTAQRTLVADIQASGLTLDQFQAQSAGESLAAAGFNTTQIATLNSLGITTLTQAVTALKVNGVSLNVTTPTGRLALPSVGRSAYDFSELHAQPNYDYRLLDQNETSLSFVGVGAALALVADAGKFHVPVPTLSGQAFGFWNDPDLLGGRARLDGYISDKTHYALEGDALRLLTGNNVGWYTKPDSVASVEQQVTDQVTVFAGRRRYYSGPVFQDEVNSQLIADRYTGAGAAYKGDGVKLEAAYLYDDNPDVAGAQHGALGTATFRTGTGTVGVNYLYVPKVGSGTGITGDAAYPIFPGKIEAYAELGRGPDNRSLQTYGGYFPRIYEMTDVDLFVEYGYHENIGHALSVIANRDIKKYLSVRGYVSFLGNSDTKAGAAAIFKFSTR